MIEVKHLYVSFTKEFFTLNDINFHLKPSQKMVIVGSKESGRTAMLRTLVGLESKAKGEILYKGIQLEKIDFENDIALGYLPANSPFLEKKTVKQNIEYVLKIRSPKSNFLETKVNNALVEYGLDFIKNKKVKELNYLDRVKLSLASLSVRSVDLFLIDDIFERLSTLERKKIIKSIKDLIKMNGATAIIMTDNQEVADAFGYDTKYLVYGSLLDSKEESQAN